MTSYKLLTYQSAKGPRAGLMIDEKIYDAAALTRRDAYANVLGILEDWRAAQKQLSAVAANVRAKKAKGAKPVPRAKLLAPILYPSALYCAGANYTDHMNEMAAVQGIQPEPDPHSLGLNPWHFIKASRSVIGPQVKVKLPAYSKMVDWEAELTAVIGRPAKNVPLDKALDYVAGYTIANDLSARDSTKRANVSDTSPFKFDWVGQKSFDQACPVGPWIVPAKDIRDPQNLGIKLWVNDVLKQDSHTSKMIFTLAEQIAHLSTRMTLYPGDLVLTGTPAGVGMGRREFLKSGDVVKVWVEGVGTLTNTMV
jgi:2-keto-4-pentenoate hydratase/2-oxohepta-3-ene-1,7-dioic acid hydratase in catechol pathway